MKKFVLIIIAITFLNQGFSQQFKPYFSGVDKFWTIKSILEKDKLPSDNLWDELFATTCYKYIVSTNTSAEKLKKRFQIAYMPSNEEQRKEHIVKILDNPFKIFWNYQKAAMDNPNRGYVFSKESIDYLKLLKKTYLIKN